MSLANSLNIEDRPMKIPQYNYLDHEKLREAQQILDEIMNDVRSPLHNPKHPRHEQVKEAVAVLENEIFQLVCEQDGQFQKIDINSNNQQEEVEPVQNLAQAELSKKSRNRRSKQDLITKKSRVRREVKDAVTIESHPSTISSCNTKL